MGGEIIPICVAYDPIDDDLHDQEEEFEPIINDNSLPDFIDFRPVSTGRLVLPPVKRAPAGFCEAAIDSGSSMITVPSTHLKKIKQTFRRLGIDTDNIDCTDRAKMPNMKFILMDKNGKLIELRMDFILMIKQVIWKSLL